MILFDTLISVCLMFMIYTGADTEQHTSDDAARYKKQIKREGNVVLRYSRNY